MCTFYHCTKLSKVTLPESVEKTFDGTFAECTSLKEISLPNSLQQIGGYCFWCSGLNSISIPSNVLFVFAYSFQNCTDLESVTISEGKHTIENGCFSFCTKLQSIKIPQDVDSLYFNLFSHCYSLENVILHSNIKINSETFSFCYSLQTITIPDNTQFKGNCFLYCTSLTDIKLSNNILEFSEGLFDSCIQLESIQIPNSLKIIDKSAFTNCIALSSINIPNSVTSIGELAFNNCTALSSINIGNSVITIGKSAFSNCISLTKIDIPDSVTTVNESAFINCTSLVAINMSNSVNKLSYYLFSNCISLKEFTISEHIISIGKYVFYNCAMLQTVKILSSDIIAYYSDIFVNCSMLNDVYYNGTSNPDRQVTIFVNCPNLEYVKVPPDYKDNLYCKIPVKKIGDIPITPTEPPISTPDEKPIDCTIIDPNCVECLSSSNSCIKCSSNYELQDGKCIFDLDNCRYEINKCLSCEIGNDGVICTKCQEDYGLSKDKKECIEKELVSCQVFGCSRCYNYDQTKCIYCNDNSDFNRNPIDGQCQCIDGYVYTNYRCTNADYIDEILPSVVIDFADSNLVQFSDDSSTMTLKTDNFENKDHSDNSIFMVSVPNDVTKIEIPQNDLQLKILLDFRQEKSVTINYKQSANPLIVQCNSASTLVLPPENNMEIIANSNVTINSLDEKEIQNQKVILEETKEISIKKVSLLDSKEIYFNSLDSNINVEELYIDKYLSDQAVYGQFRPQITTFSKIIIENETNVELNAVNANTVVVNPRAKLDIASSLTNITNIDIRMPYPFSISNTPIKYKNFFP